MLTRDELELHQRRWQTEDHTYRLASTYMAGEFMAFKGAHPTTVRVVFSRDPQIKRLDSINSKIERHRTTNDRYGYNDIKDIIALTVLCPYPSDVADFVEWLKASFTVHTSDSDARREDTSGHIALHYIISIHDDASRAHPNLRGVVCELQVKTLLQEAFDAKSHDVTYKTGRRHVASELHKQFRLLSGLLAAVDAQSEFLKDLIMQEDRDSKQRRELCLRSYFKQEDAEAVGRRLNINWESTNTGQLSLRMRYDSDMNGVTWELCKFAVYCALARDDSYLKAEAKRYAEEFVSKAPDDIQRHLVRGSILWALGAYSEALNSLQAIIDSPRAEKVTPDLKIKAMNSYVYFVSDCQAVGDECRPDWQVRAGEYVALLEQNIDDHVLDTIGFYRIVFGSTRLEVETGRRMLQEALSTRSDDPLYKYFYDKHECIALRSLLSLTLAQVNQSTARKANI